MSNWFKKNWPHLAAIAFFLLICLIYFSPVLMGKKLYQGDVMQAAMGQKEIMSYKKVDGTGPLWTNSMFSGMPSYQIWAQYPTNFASHFFTIWSAVFPNPINFLLLYLLGGYFLFAVLRFRPLICVIGAIAIAFTSYNLIIIEAGHTTKALAIAFFAPILAGILLAFRGRYLLGAAITALFLALEIRSNHIQMTYYLMLAVMILVIVEFYSSFRDKKLAEFIKASSALLVGAILALGVNFGTLWVNYEYAQETIRGKSDLVASTASTSKGLDKEYAYQWSEGVKETVTILIPDAYGGGSGLPLNDKSNVYEELIKNNVPVMQAKEFTAQIGSSGRYWGDKPFTSGPYYFGAIIVFLFIYGLSILKGPAKWWLLAASILSILLSWGRNFQGFSDLFFDYFPMYSKFRAVESILVIAGLTFPVLAILALKQIADEETNNNNNEELIKKLKYTLYGVGGFLLIFIAVPGLFLSFNSPNDGMLLDQLKQATGDQLGQNLMNALVNDRMAIARMDAIRSLLFVLIGAGLIWAIISKKIKTEYALTVLGLTILIDMWGLDKRYLKDENFVEKRMVQQNLQPREVDVLINQDKDPNFRVYEMTPNAFSNAQVSGFHKSIGGYHAAKLKRYQNLIDSQLVKGNPFVFNMLNTKYIITADSSGRPIAQRNNGALGNAWFVSGIHFVANANEELKALDKYDPKFNAIVDEKFRKMVDIFSIDVDPNAYIKLTNYHPDHLTYEYNSRVKEVTVFSEIYYDKGWNAYVDGKPFPYFRANYVLRAMQIPAGKHIVEFKFEPKSYYIGNKISLASSILLLGGLLGALWMDKRKKKKETVNTPVKA